MSGQNFRYPHEETVCRPLRNEPDFVIAGSPGPSNADESFENNMLRTPMRSKQEQEDFEMAFKLQRELDMESKTTPSRKKINDHFYPLRQKSADSSNRPPAKRLKTK